ncbi:MAG: MBL fold metallo-hydrolase [Candidatus Magasanikbacteria bacterium]|jgi:L-ascorbate metabolism protein UlaG (beta-lactamase superfamily)
MHLQWLGQTCVKLQTKNFDEDVVILIDPYRPAKGEFPRSFSPQIGFFSHGTDEAVTLSQNPFVLDTLGECETKGVMVYSLPGGDNNLIFKINAEGLNIVHLGKMKKKIENGDLEKIGSVDILFLPVGGGEYLSPEDAVAIVTELEPRIVIPMAYECDTDPKALPVSAFIKEMGLKPEATDKKIIIKQKDLPQDETKMYILEKNY